MFKCIGNCAACGRCKSTGLARQVNEQKAGMLRMPDDFVAETGKQGYAIAFDIGTTTVVGMLWDLYQGKLVGAAAKANPQAAHGQDVISRITFAGKKENLKLLHDEIIGCLNEIIGDLCTLYGIDRNAICRAAVCGNTTMSHLFAGYDPTSLAVAPFVPAYEGTLRFLAEEIGLTINGNCEAMLIPNIAGHVGGDITAGILATRLEAHTGKALFIDIGTNGEIVYIQDGKMCTCSTAAGPAFEGAAIYQGMRAAEGAIERIRIEDGDVQFKTIGDVPPIGICGSGLIDAVAEMKKASIINETGRMATAEEYEKNHSGSALAERLREGADGREFILVSKVSGEDIVITQKDIRQVQLAKAAIAAGTILLMRQMGSVPEELDEVIIAGAFGSYIDNDSAVEIGLLPNIVRQKITNAGNTAGAGVLMSVASSQEAQRIIQIPGKLQHIELANLSEFQNCYLGEMRF